MGERITKTVNEVLNQDRVLTLVVKIKDPAKAHKLYDWHLRINSDMEGIELSCIAEGDVVTSHDILEDELEGLKHLVR